MVGKLLCLMMFLLTKPRRSCPLQAKGITSKLITIIVTRFLIRASLHWLLLIWSEVVLLPPLLNSLFLSLTLPTSLLKTTLNHHPDLLSVIFHLLGKLHCIGSWRRERIELLPEHHIRQAVPCHGSPWYLSHHKKILRLAPVLCDVNFFACCGLLLLAPYIVYLGSYAVMLIVLCCRIICSCAGCYIFVYFGFHSYYDGGFLKEPELLIIHYEYFKAFTLLIVFTAL